MFWLLQNWKLVIAIATIGGGAACGWTVRGWHEQSKDLAEIQGAKAAIDASMKRESDIAGKLEARLQELKANERVIERETVKIVNRPIYQSVCLDDDGLRIINLSKAGTGTAKHDHTVPSAP